MISELEIPKPFHFEATLKTHGWFQLPPFYWEEKEQTLAWVMRLNKKLAVIRCKTVGETAATSRVRFCGNSTEKTRPIIERKFKYIMNLDLDLSHYYKICQDDAVLKEVPKRGIGRLMRAESLWEDIFKSICGTNVQWRQAVKMIHNIAAIGDKAPGTDYHLFPTPAQILEAGELFLKDVGRVGYRSRYLLNVAERFVNGEPNAEKIEKGEMSGAEMKKYFLGFMGVGSTTARYLLALHGHFAEMSVDSLVVKYMTERHFNGRRPIEKEIVEFYDRFGEWRYLAYWMEFIINEGWTPDAR